MTLAKRLWLTIFFTLASLALALILTGQQLSGLTRCCRTVLRGCGIPAWPWRA